MTSIKIFGFYSLEKTKRKSKFFLERLKKGETNAKISLYLREQAPIINKL